MNLTVSQFIWKVKVEMEELTSYGEGLAVLDPSTGSPVPVTSGLVLLRPETYEKPIETYIREKIKDAYYSLVAVCPYYLLPSETFAGVTPTLNTDGSGYFTLPTDFYMLKDFQLQEWERPVMVVMEESDPRYKDQFNKYARGNFSKPVCVRRADNTVMELYSVNGTTMTFERGHYVPMLNLQTTTDGDIIDNQNLTFDENFVLPWVCMTASKVFDIYGQPDLSKSALSHVATLLK